MTDASAGADESSWGDSRWQERRVSAVCDLSPSVPSRRRKRRGSGCITVSAFVRPPVCGGRLAARGGLHGRVVRASRAKGAHQTLGSGEADIAGDFTTQLTIQLDRGTPIVVLGGIHVGCFELFGTERVRTVRDLKRKTVGVRGLDTPPHKFLSSLGPTLAWILAKTSSGLRGRQASRCASLAAAINLTGRVRVLFRPLAAKGRDLVTRTELGPSHAA